MISVTSQNLLDFVQSYFASLGFDADARAHFTAQNFTEGLVLKLPAVCLVPGNKPETSHSKQTHIHITGDNRYFFFPKHQVDSAAVSTGDISQPLLLSPQNLAALQNNAFTESQLEFVPSYTLKKIACRNTQLAQVQISKLRADDASFVKLRHCLYENDLLIFLRPRLGEALTVVAIPHDFYADQYSIPNSVCTGLESRNMVTVKSALSAAADEFPDSAVVGDAAALSAALSDAIYQEVVDLLPRAAELPPAEYIPAPFQESGARSLRPATDPALGKAALLAGGYRCAINPDHTTFQKPNGEPYLEVHHLIPLEQQQCFWYKLDTLANLVPLCPLCHKLLHYGRAEERNAPLLRLYEARKGALAQSGLVLTADEFLRFYEE